MHGPSPVCMRRTRFSERLKQCEDILRTEGCVSKYDIAMRFGITPTYAEMIIRSLELKFGPEVEWKGSSLWLKDSMMSQKKLRQATLDERSLWITR